jgi:hypothetical protein
MTNKLLKTAIVGTTVNAICCFTPFLDWVISALDLLLLVIYLDTVMLPLLTLSVLLLMVDLVALPRCKSKKL